MWCRLRLCDTAIDEVDLMGLAEGFIPDLVTSDETDPLTLVLPPFGTLFALFVLSFLHLCFVMLLALVFYRSGRERLDRSRQRLRPRPAEGGARRS